MTSSTSRLQIDSDPLGIILERLNGSVDKVTKLREFLGDLETELSEIRQQCENEIHARRSAASGVVVLADNSQIAVENKIHKSSSQARMAGGLSRPVSLQRGEKDSNPIGTDKAKRSSPMRERVGDKGPEKARLEPKRDPKSNPTAKSAVLSRKSEPKVHSTSPSHSSHSQRVSGGSGLPALNVKGKNSSASLMPVSRPRFRTTPAKAQPRGGVAHGIRVETPSIPEQIPVLHLNPPRPPIHPPLFVENFDVSSYPPELKQEGDDWSVLFNPSPKVKRRLDVNLMHTLTHKSEVLCVKISQDEKWVAMGSWAAEVYDLKTGVKNCTLDHPNSRFIESICFSPDGMYLATGGDNKQILVWDIAKKEIHDIFEGHQGDVYALQFLPNGRSIISGSIDGTLRIWDLHDKTFKVLTIDDHYPPPPVSHGIRSVAISPDGRYVAAGGLDTVVSVWDIGTGLLVQKLRGHKDFVHSVAFTPDGKGLISGSQDCTLKYWDVSGLDGAESLARTSSSPCLINLTSHESFVYSTAISHDGTFIVSGYLDGKVLFWDRRTGVAQCMLSGHQGSVLQVDLSPMGNFLATVDVDGRARIWNYGVFSLV